MTDGSQQFVENSAEHAHGSPTPVPVGEQPAGDAGAAASPPAALESESRPPEEPISSGSPELAHQQQEESAADVSAPVEEEEEEGDVKPIYEDVQGPEEIDRKWYILKVQSNREETIREGLQRRVAIAGLDRFFGEIIVPTETVTEFKGGKKKVVKRKLYPGYLVVNMEINDDTWFLVRETPGIGDFTGRIGRPAPMAAADIAKIMSTQAEETAEQPKMKIRFNKGDRVKIKEGTFENFEGDVDGIDEANGRVTVMINIFGRSTPVELEHWQVEAV